jgi:DNA-binding MarR family transcriptional regulator
MSRNELAVAAAPGPVPRAQRPKPELARLFSLQVRRFNVLYTRASTVIFRRDFGLTLNEWRTLSAAWLLDRPAVTLSQVAAEAGFDAGLASRLVASLVRKGFLSRAGRAGDARYIDLRVTAAGERLARRVFRVSERRNDRLMARLAPRERKALAAAMDRLIDEARMMLNEETARGRARRPNGGAPG